MHLNLIYSDSMDGIMGVNNDLYCKLKSDLRMFQKITSIKFNNHENIIIMGYNTWESIGKPLKNRINIVISKNHFKEMCKVNDVLCFQTLKDCFEGIKSINYGKIFIIGGAYLLKEIIKHYFDSIDIIYQTQIIDEVNNFFLQSYNVIYNDLPLIKYEMEKKIKNIKSTKKKEEGVIFDFENGKYITKEIEYCENIYQKSRNINNQESQYLYLLNRLKPSL